MSSMVRAKREPDRKPIGVNLIGDDARLIECIREHLQKTTGPIPAGQVVRMALRDFAENKQIAIKPVEDEGQ